MTVVTFLVPLLLLAPQPEERCIFKSSIFISMDMDMMCQLIQMARLDGDAMIITDLLPATQAQDQQHQESSGAEADTINGFKMHPAAPVNDWGAFQSQSWGELL